jgi:hypothetical protein
MWLVAGSWAPLVGLVVALGLHRGLAANWDVLTILLIRLVISYGAAKRAFASRARWRAIAWMAFGGAAIVVVLAPWYPRTVYQFTPQEERGDSWQDITTLAALAAAWYSLLAVLLYRPVERGSHEQTDYSVALAALWAALPILTTNLARTNVMSSERRYSAYLMLERITNVLFGSHDWFRIPSREYRGPGAWIQDWDREYLLLGASLALAGLLPVGVALLSALRIIARRRWLRRVEDGRISGWRLLDATTPRPDGLSVLTGDGQGAVKVLTRLRNQADPYRSCADVEPVALVAAHSDHCSDAARASRKL